MFFFFFLGCWADNREEQRSEVSRLNLNIKYITLIQGKSPGSFSFPTFQTVSNMGGVKKIDLLRGKQNANLIKMRSGFAKC
jgi:hypothetical protein